MSSGTILHIISGDLWGGKEAQMLFQLTALKELGWHVRVLLFNSADTFSNYKDADIPCDVVDENQGYGRFLKGVFSIARSSPPDLIVSHGYKETYVGLLLSVFLRCPVISTFHGSLEVFSGFARVKACLNHNIHRLISMCCARNIVVVSHSLVRELGFLRLKKVYVVHNVVGNAPTSDEKPVSFIGQQKTPFSRRPALIIVGRLVAVKRIDLAIEALSIVLKGRTYDAKCLPHLYIVGQGLEQFALEKLTAELAIEQHVSFLGFQDNADKLIASADVLLMTSDKEGIPTVVLEAVRSGVKIVSTELEGVREIFDEIGDYPIVFVPNGNSNAIAEGVTEVLESDSVQILGSQAQKKLQMHFSPEVAAKKLSELYRTTT